jgi:general secretion pathway protein C
MLLAKRGASALARATVPGALEAVNFVAQTLTAKNLNHDTYLPSLAAVRDALVLRRWMVGARWLMVAVAAYAGALAVNAALAFWFDAPELPRSETKRDAAKPRVDRARSHSIIFERNLFGGEPIVVASAGERTVAVDSLDLRLLGTAQVDGKGFAVVEDTAGSRQDVFVIGEHIFDGPTLVAVGDGNAEISVNGRKQMLEIASVAPERSDDGDAGPAAAGAGGIRQTGTNSYLVDRREVEHSIENLNKIATQMRAVPYLKDGAAIGFRVFNIRANSIFDRIGLKNGDVIQKDNGVDLDSPTKALTLLEDVQTTEEIRVDLLRSNAPTTLVYTVR